MHPLALQQPQSSSTPTPVTMFKLIVLAAVLAMAAAAPGFVAAPGLAYSAAIPAVHAYAPYAYTSGIHVAYSVEPVEQHGYRIAF